MSCQRVRIISASALGELLGRENPSLADRPSEHIALFDLRGKRDFLLRHLPGALPMPAHQLKDSLATRFDERWPEVERATTPLVLYCYGPECTRSRIGATRAARMGFRELYVFKGGLMEWQDADLPHYGIPPDSLPQARIPRPPVDPRRKDPRRR